MATFLFAKLHPHDDIDLIGEVQAANARMEARYPGCGARIVKADDNRTVAVDMRVGADAESAACIDWYSAELVRRRVVMLRDERS